MKKAKVVVIGAGSAGLYALSQIRRATDDFLVVDHGPLGTTCARVGCMPSKVLIQVAEDYHRREALAGEGIAGGDGLRVDPVAVMAHVRKLRDGFVGHIVPRTEAMGDKLVRGTARFVGPNAIEVEGERIEAERFVLAVGSRPVVPQAWNALGDRMMTTDSLFEQETLPRSIGVIGLGVIGLEMGQALSRLGVAVTGVHKYNTVCGISDPAVRDFMVGALAEEFPLWLGRVPELSGTANGVRIRVGERETEVERVLVSLGRRSNLDRLDLGAAGIELDSRGMPALDPQTGRIEGHSIFVAGDAGGERLLLHEAGDEGRIAGVNALRDDAPRRFVRKPRFDIVFSDPNIAAVGADWSDLAGRDDVVVGARDFAGQSRAKAMGRNRGILRIYGRKSDGLLLGAAMAAPRGEHLAHMLAWAIQDGKTVFDMLRQGFYHPVVEEGLQDALYGLARRVENQPAGPIELIPDSAAESIPEEPAERVAAE